MFVFSCCKCPCLLFYHMTSSFTGTFPVDDEINKLKLKKLAALRGCLTLRHLDHKVPSAYTYQTYFPSHRLNFSKSVGERGQRAKTAQGTINILMESIFSSKVTPFLTSVGGWGLSRFSPTWGGGWGSPKEICSFAPILSFEMKSDSEKLHN